MFNGKKVLALVPARGGSKRLPRKNLRNFCGKPLVCWTIDAARESSCVDYVVVSTEDSEIQEVARNCGVDLVIERPVGLASDDADTIDVLLHSLKIMSERRQEYNYIALLQPTSPLRNSKHIDDAFRLMETKGANVVIAVCETEHPVQWTGHLPPNLSMDQFIKDREFYSSNNQAHTDYQINGAIYLLDIDNLFITRTIFPDKGAYAYVMDRKYSIDIDTELDFFIAQCLMESNRWLN